MSTRNPRGSRRQRRDSGGRRRAGSDRSGRSSPGSRNRGPTPGSQRAGSPSPSPHSRAGGRATAGRFASHARAVAGQRPAVQSEESKDASGASKFGNLVGTVVAGKRAFQQAVARGGGRPRFNDDARAPSPESEASSSEGSYESEASSEPSDVDSIEDMRPTPLDTFKAARSSNALLAESPTSLATAPASVMSGGSKEPSLRNIHAAEDGRRAYPGRREHDQAAARAAAFRAHEAARAQAVAQQHHQARLMHAQAQAQAQAQAHMMAQAAAAQAQAQQIAHAQAMAVAMTQAQMQAQMQAQAQLHAQQQAIAASMGSQRMAVPEPQLRDDRRESRSHSKRASVQTRSPEPGSGSGSPRQRKASGGATTATRAGPTSLRLARTQAQSTVSLLHGVDHIKVVTDSDSESDASPQRGRRPQRTPSKGVAGTSTTRAVQGSFRPSDKAESLALAASRRRTQSKGGKSPMPDAERVASACSTPSVGNPVPRPQLPAAEVENANATTATPAPERTSPPPLIDAGAVVPTAVAGVPETPGKKKKAKKHKRDKKAKKAKKHKKSKREAATPSPVPAVGVDMVVTDVDEDDLREKYNVPKARRRVSLAVLGDTYDNSQEALLHSEHWKSADWVPPSILLVRLARFQPRRRMLTSFWFPMNRPATTRRTKL